MELQSKAERKKKAEKQTRKKTERNEDVQVRLKRAEQ